MRRFCIQLIEKEPQLALIAEEKSPTRISLRGVSTINCSDMEINMANKYYAVRVGRTPGIYMNWNDCKAQIDGFSGAVYKSFASVTEADAFINMGASDFVITGDFLSLPSSKAVAYVDGSFLATTGEYAYGVVIFHNGEQIELSGKNNDVQMASMRNVAGEITGSMVAMEYAVSHNVSELDIYHDYEGISKWCQGLWKTNKKGTIDYKKFYDNIKGDVKVNFVKVKGHSGDKYNDLADSLAKGALGIR